MLSEVKKSKSSWLPNLYWQLCAVTLVVWITLLHVSLYQDMLEQLPLLSIALLNGWTRNALEMILGNQTKQRDL